MSAPADPRWRDGLLEVTHATTAGPGDVWSALCNGWGYASWVVGTSRIRAVDDAWPAPDSKVHHSVGVWPLVIDDDTTVLESEVARRLVLQARGWPAGEARVEVTVAPSGAEASSGSVITIVEDAVEGPGTLVPRPLRQALIAWRNRESLRRLAFIAEGQRHRDRTVPT